MMSASNAISRPHHTVYCLTIDTTIVSRHAYDQISKPLYEGTKLAFLETVGNVHLEITRKTEEKQK